MNHNLFKQNNAEETDSNVSNNEENSYRGRHVKHHLVLLKITRSEYIAN